MRIVVFGAGGFVGGWICEELAERSGVEAIVCVRKWASATRLARRGIRVTQADLEDAGQLPDILKGADAVVNAAMPVPSREPQLAAALYAASVQAGIGRFVQFSSAAVYGNRVGNIDEEVPASPADDYSRGKAEMERRLIAAASVVTGSALVILRPSIIYGPFADAWTVRYVERVVRGRWRGLGRLGDGTCNLVHAHDVARAAITAATGDIPPGVHLLNINGPDAVSWNEYIERLGDALGIPNRTVPNGASFRAMAAAAEIIRRGATLTGVRSLYRRSKGPARTAMTSAKAVTNLYPTFGELRLLRRKAHYAAHRATRVLGVTPVIPLEEGLRQSVAWCRVHGVV